MLHLVQKTGDHQGVGPSHYMEIGLNGLVGALLLVSIIGIAYVYGFSLDGNALDNISAAVRAVGVDGGFFLGLYFSRRHWTREKQGLGDAVRATLAGLPWFLVAIIMAAVSWLSNTLFVNGSTTIITQASLDHAGITIIDAQQANWMIGGIPLLIILLYSIVPAQAQSHVDTRAPEEIEQEAEREAARIRAQNKVAAARAEGAGQRLRIVAGGLVGQALNLEERAKREKHIKDMRIALETAGHDTTGMRDEDIEIQAVARGVWDSVTDQAVPLEDDEEEQEAAARDAARPVRAPLPGNPPVALSTSRAALATKAALSVQEAAQVTLRSPRTINEWCKARKIPRVRRTAKGAYRIPRQSLVAIGWLTEDGSPSNYSNPEMPALSAQMMSAVLQQNGHSLTTPPAVESASLVPGAGKTAIREADTF